ncbi:MAG TPA: ATP-binding protein [Trinickia sp.]|nr:ATP-binding protein [Trinickia sp.]
MTIDLFRDGERCVLRIADDGIGAASNARQLVHSTGMGLPGIADRVAQLHGTLSIHSALGSGFSIVARLPIDTLPPRKTSRLPRSR